ncbi:MAG: M48 family metalloprotease [Bacillota bacterium]
MLFKCLAFATAALLAAGVALGASAPPASTSNVPLSTLQDLSAPTPDQGNGIPTAQSGSDFNLPQIGTAGGDVVTPQQEYEIGLQVINELRDAGLILDDPLLQQYIQDLGKQLSSHSDNPQLNFGFYVIDDDDINATTLPGGFIVVNSGMLLLTDTEDELAGVMAHEIGHVTQRHLSRQVEDQQDRSFINIATMLAAVLAATRTNDPDVAMGALATAQGAIIQHQINYTRGDESEADRVGMATLARAGFQPKGMVDFFGKVHAAYSSLNGLDKVPEFLLDHPLDLTRMADLENRAEQLSVPERPESRSYALMKARLQSMQNNDTADKMLTYFKSGIESSKGWDQVAMRYGLALTYQKALDYPDAIALMQDLVKQYDDVIPFRIGLADAEMHAGRIPDAINTYASALRLFPDSTPLILSYAGDLVDAGKSGNAVDLLLPLTSARRGGPDALRLLAKAYDKKGDSADSHYYMSEYYMANGLASAAVDQLRIALATPGINTVQRQRYSARLHRVEEAAKEARQEQREQKQQPP